MEKLNVKLIALDLDDTLLDDKQQIPQDNIDALRECVKKGIYVVLCSGRADDAILPFIRKLEIADSEYGRYLAAINGCSVFDLHQKKQILCNKVASDVLLRTNEIAEANGFYSEVYTPDTIYYRRLTEWTKLDVDLCGLKGEQVEDYDNFLKQGFTKMLVPGEPAALQGLQRTLREEFGDRAVIFVSKPYFLEILPPNCGKGEAITWLANHIGIDPKTTMAFGDSMNDESMIRQCGYGVVMKNGLQEMKDIADFVTEKTNVEGGVGHFLRKYVL